jgi:hypothetical protein
VSSGQMTASLKAVGQVNKLPIFLFVNQHDFVMSLEEIVINNNNGNSSNNNNNTKY